VSERRQAGEWVWLRPGAGFCGDSGRLRAELQPEEDGDHMPCVLCDDPECREWSTVWTEHDERWGKRHTLTHVSECEMADQQWATPAGGAAKESEAK
jgi:hypothetical protein